MASMDSGLKKYTSIQDRLVLQLNRCLEEVIIPEWMTKRKTTLMKKDTLIGMITTMYRLIKYLPMKWKILTAQINEEIYYSLGCPVGWGCRIHWLHICREVRPPPKKKTSVLVMTLNNLMVRFQQCWSFGECGVPLYCHYSQVHSGPAW